MVALVVCGSAYLLATEGTFMNSFGLASQFPWKKAKHVDTIEVMCLNLWQIIMSVRWVAHCCLHIAFKVDF